MILALVGVVIFFLSFIIQLGYVPTSYKKSMFKYQRATYCQLTRNLNLYKSNKLYLFMNFIESILLSYSLHCIVFDYIKGFQIFSLISHFLKNKNFLFC